VVDITNYVLYELGQPLHAFDLATLAKEGDRAAIVVRTAEEGERLTTLDRQDRVLASDTLVIADPSGAVALAGVMGGEATEVSDTTHDILLESACFDPRSISRTSRRLSLISEASLRFERGVDPELALRAVDRAAELLVEVAGGTVAPGVIDVYPGSREPCRIELRTTRVNGLLGTSLTTAEIIGILGPLGIETLAEDDVVIATVPAFRPDLEREVDLIEEVARIWGMERIASTLPGGRERVGGVNEVRRLALGLTASLLAVGLDEHIGYSAGDPRDLERLGWELASDELLVEIINPMSEEQAVLRWTLLGSLLRAASHNQRRGVAGVRLFEVGSVFTTANGRKQPKERMVVSGVLAGAHDGASWYGGARAADVFDATAAIEGVMGGLHLAGWSVRAADRPWLQSGRSGEVILDGDVVGWVGEISAGVLDSFGLAAPAVAFELSATALGLATRARSVRYREIPRFPAVSLDVALIVPDELPSADVQRAIQEAGGPLLESVHLFDVYRDPDEAGEGERRLPECAKSLAFALMYRAPDRTLNDEEVRKAHERMLAKVTERLGAEIRS
jgi:phenylalanyl-tRNA synthetase beta chain